MSNVEGTAAASRMLFQAHPWHGLSAGERSPDVVTVFVELVPTDTVKYEDRQGERILRLDARSATPPSRPSRTASSRRTLCDAEGGGAVRPGRGPRRTRTR